MKIINENIPDYQNSIDDKTWETFISNLSGNILLE
jgi:hypothetical protein